jgi:hypothetical protein
MTKRNITVPVENLTPVVQPAANYYTLVRFPAWARYFSPFSAQTGLEAHLTSYTMRTADSFLADKAAGT